MADPDDLQRALSGDKNLSGVFLQDADLSDVDLSDADLSGAYLFRAVLTRANLRGANLTGANLSGADLRGSNLNGAILSSANLSGADLTDAALTAAALNGASLNRASLARANLSGALLSYADLTRADFSGANLSGAVLIGASRFDAIGLSAPAAAPPASPAPAATPVIGRRSKVTAAAQPRRWTPDSSKPKPRPYEPLTVGLLLNPKYFEVGIGIYGNPSFEEATSVVSAVNTDVIAEGWIEKNPRNSYSIPAMISGYPRVHSYPGLKDKYKSIKGWGTPLYVCAATAAELDARGVISLLDGTVGSKAGVCSWDNAEGGRMEPANEWWDKALERKLSTRTEMCANLPRKGKVCDVIDVMTYKSAVSQNLVVALPSRLEPYTLPFWNFRRDDRLEGVNKKVLAIVNTGYLAKERDGLGAMKRLVYMAERAGMTKKQITSMIDRYNQGVDSGAVRFEQSMTRQNPSRSRKVAPMRPVFYGPRRNPSAVSPALERTLEELHEQRLELGYANLADLP